MVVSFSDGKDNALTKADKSSIGKWDEKIISLCEKINSLEDYYTTSSCSGRIVVLKDKGKERGNLFVKVWHDEISVDELKRELDKLPSDYQGIIKFKQEPPILHVACKDLKDTLELLMDARGVGFKRSGVISKSERFIVEIISTEKLEFPIVKNNKMLVSDEFLDLVIEKSNENLKKGWEKTEKLKKLF